MFTLGTLLKARSYLPTDGYKPLLWPIKTKTPLSMDDARSGYFVWNKDSILLQEGDIVVLTKAEHMKVNRKETGTILYVLYEGSLWHTSCFATTAFDKMFEVIDV